MRVRSALVRSVAAVTLLSLVTLAEGVACSDKKRGALMLSLDTDMRAPKDVNAVSLTISANDVIKFNTIARVDPDGEVRFPATIAIVEPDDPNATIRIRIIALSETTPRVMRDVRTTVPRDGFVAALAIPLTFVNDGSAIGTLPAGLLPAKDGAVATKTITLSDTVTLGPRDFNAYDGVIVSPCGPDDRETVIEGECADSTVDSSKLPAFDPSLVGANVAGQCFDVATCFGTADHKDVDPALEVVEVDVPACRFPRDARPNPNLGLATAASARGSGECLGEKCIVPLDQGGGWTDDGTYIVLSKGVCRKLASQAAILVKNVSANPACTTKVSTRPVCQAGASSTDGGVNGGDAPDAALVLVAEATPVQVVKSRLASAIAVTALGVYHAGPAGLLLLPTTGASKQIAPAAPGGEPWVSGQYLATVAFGQTTRVMGTGDTVGYVIVEGLDASAPQIIHSADIGFHLTAVAVTSTAGNLWALSNADNTRGGLYTTGFFSGTPTYLSPSDLAITGTPVTALGHLAKNAPAQLLVGEHSGKVRLCNLGTQQCGAAAAAAQVPIDAIAADALATNVSAYLLTPDSVIYAQKPGGDLVSKVVIDEPGNLGGTVVPPTSYVPRGVTLAGKCGFYSSPKGIEYVSTDGTFNGWLVDLQGTGGPAVSLRTYAKDIYYALFTETDAAPNVGGGVFRVPVPARCMP